MSSTSFNALHEVTSGSFNWIVKVRIIRKWRGLSNTGQEFKGFNLLLLDAENCRLPAFVPGTVADKFEKEIVVGSIHTIGNYTVKDYKPDEKFRSVCCEKQIYFSNFTEIQVISADDIMIPNNLFDFYDLGDLKDIADDNTYLTDVIGVIEKDFPLRKFVNKKGKAQVQIKFEITDGRCSNYVTFWDNLAQEFSSALDANTEFPAIVIISSAKITSYMGKTDIANVAATHFYLNYNHHSVTNLRRMISTPLFEKTDFSSQIPETLEEHDIESIKSFGLDYVNKEVVCEIKLILILEMGYWFKGECSACYKEIEVVKAEYKCIGCNRKLPYADMKFHIMADAIDHKDSITILIPDRAVRTLICKTALEVIDEGHIPDQVPCVLRSLESKWYMTKLSIGPQNIGQSDSLYYATDMFEINAASSHAGENENKVVPSKSGYVGSSMLEEQLTNVSASSIHLDGIEELNFDSPDVIKKKRSQRLKEKQAMNYK